MQIKLQEIIENHIDSTTCTAKTDANIEAVRTLRRIMSADYCTQPDDLERIAKFTGWGPALSAFSLDTNPEDWSRRQAALREVMPSEWYQSASGATLDAYYTDPKIVKSIWRAVESLGFQGGKVLDPSMGMGYFRLFAPSHLSRLCQWTGVELEPVTYHIQKALTCVDGYDIKLYGPRGFQNTAFPNDLFDLAISNVPFGDYKVYDPYHPDTNRDQIHNFFVKKMVKLVRPGGLIVAITSVGAINSKTNSEFRHWLVEHTNNLGMVWLPSNCFKAFGTEVSAVLLFLEKRSSADAEMNARFRGWKHSFEVDRTVLSDVWDDDADAYLQYNSWLKDNVIGTFVRDKLYPSPRLSVKLFLPGGKVLAPIESVIVELDSKLSRLRSRVSPTELTVQPLHYQHFAQPRKILEPEHQDMQEGDVIQINGAWYTRKGVYLEQIDSDADAVVLISQIHTAMNDVLNAQMDCSDKELAVKQANLKSLYDKFVEKYGFLSDRKNLSAFKENPKYFQIVGLEVQSGKKKAPRLADVFTKRTAVSRTPNPVCNSPQDALIVSLNQRTEFDLPLVCSLLPAMNESEIVHSLFESGAILYDCHQQKWVATDEFLSGNVVEKLEQAQDWLSKADSTSELFDWVTASAEALTDVLPKIKLPPASPEIKAAVAVALGESRCDINAPEIEIRLGQPFIPTSVIEDFVLALASKKVSRFVHIRVSYAKTLALFSIQASQALQLDPSITSVWGTPYFNAVQLIECACNNKDPVSYRVDEDGNRSVDNEATSINRAKLQQIKEEFVRWVWSDEERAIMLTREFNARYNSFRERQWDGSHLAFPGLNPEFAKILRQEQKNAIWQALCTKSMLFGEAVGFGKTACMVITAIRLKQLGLVNKPMLCGLNSTIPDLYDAARYLYPTAKICVAEDAYMHRDNFAQWATSIATQDWDLVIIPHSKITLIPMSGQEAYWRQQINEVVAEQSRYRNDGFILRSLRRLQRTLETQIGNIRRRQNNTVFWEQLGVDCLIVDEYHQSFKKVGIRTRLSNVSGVDVGFSSRGVDLFMKRCHIIDELGGRFYLSTGTPVTNTIGEVYTIQRYVQLDKLSAADIKTFDAWVAMFAEPVTRMEIGPHGKFKAKTRLAQFTSLQQLVGMLRLNAHIVTTRNLRRPPNWEDEKGHLTEAEIKRREELFLPVPDYQIYSIAAEPSAKQREFMHSLAARAERIQDRLVEPHEDNMLVITTDGRLASIDHCLVYPDGEAYWSGKVAKAVACSHLLLEVFKPQRLTHLVFIDAVSPQKANEDGSRNYDVYHHYKDCLVALGHSAEEIVFAHDFNTPAERRALYKRMNDGEVRVLLTSTLKGGIGVNVQKKLIATIRLDPPWRPADIEQGDGRIVRTGNENQFVALLRFATQGKDQLCGFDSYAWQVLETKLAAFQSLLESSSLVDSLYDLGDFTASYAEIKALASGDPRIMRKAEVDRQVAEISAIVDGLQKQITANMIALRNLPKEKEETEHRIAALKQDWEILQVNKDFAALATEEGTEKDTEEAETRLEPDAEAEVEVEVGVETETKTGTENEPQAKSANKKRKRYLPIRHPIYFCYGVDEPFSTTSVVEAGTTMGSLLEQIHETCEPGNYKIGEWWIDEKQGHKFDIVIQVTHRKTLSCFLAGATDIVFKIGQHPATNVYNLYRTWLSLYDRLQQEQSTLELVNRRIRSIAPRNETLNADLKLHEEKLHLLLQEQREIDTALGLLLSENADASEPDSSESRRSSDEQDSDESDDENRYLFATSIRRNGSRYHKPDAEVVQAGITSLIQSDDFPRKWLEDLVQRNGFDVDLASIWGTVDKDCVHDRDSDSVQAVESVTVTEIEVEARAETEIEVEVEVATEIEAVAEIEAATEIKVATEIEAEPTVEMTAELIAAEEPEEEPESAVKIAFAKKKRSAQQTEPEFSLFDLLDI